MFYKININHSSEKPIDQWNGVFPKHSDGSCYTIALSGV